MIVYVQAFEELEKLLPENDICIAAKEKLVKDSGVAGEAIYERIVDKLYSLPRAKGNLFLYANDDLKQE
jgi:metabotropic X receptor